ncbi:MAG: hypothetical protein JNK84_11275 [Phreatobacter sp.]|uniref:cysteine rich repeat-containing protein n=1 Tax=Phreatobacter sp. TaxID=1966341 RepID=UPI001A57A5B7|nr:cysteine rich repeat-containing protein [Phreatobacter sp.]MBL8569650.1 hypothetical protein [Phreatobacter sp.]
MRLPALTIILAALPISAFAQGESLSFSQRLAVYRACKPDLDRHCPDAGRDAGRIRACLTANQTRLSADCTSTVRQTGAR